MSKEKFSLPQGDNVGKIYAAEYSDPSFLKTTLHVSPSMSSGVASCSTSQWPVYCPQNNTDSIESPYNSRPLIPIQNAIFSNISSDSRSSQNLQNSSSFQRYEKPNRGLRHFSMKVLQKVQQKVSTTYNEVADELVNEFGARGPDMNDQNGYDQKNIRRRVYDALNVLMAMNIITKEKKEIKWVGLPTNSLQECQHLENERNNMIASVKEKLKSMKELIIQLICMKNLSAKNSASSNNRDSSQYHMELPFILLSTSSDAHVECSVSDSKDEYFFQFDSPFEVHDDFEILKRLGYANDLDKGNCPQDLIDCSKSIVPRVLHPFVQIMGQFSNDGFEEYILSHRKNIESDVSGNLTASNMRFINSLVESLPRVMESTGHGNIFYESNSQNDVKNTEPKLPFYVQSFES